MAIPVYLSITEERPADLAIGEWKRLLRQAHRETGAKWHREMAPRHFQESAHERYGYQARSQRYLYRKRQDARRGKVLMGGRVDLVRTGLMMDLVLHLAVIDATYKHAIVKMQAPHYVTLRPNVYRGSVQPDKYDETVRTTDLERESLALVQELAVRRLDTFRAPQQTLRSPHAA